MEPLMDIMGIGWYFTMLAVVGDILGLGGTYVINQKGMEWRLARKKETAVILRPAIVEALVEEQNLDKISIKYSERV